MGQSGAAWPGVRRVSCAFTLALASLAGSACAPMQSVPLDVAPRPVSLWVDGEAQAGGVPAGIRLRADRPHVLFFRRAGYRPERVLLASQDSESGRRLNPSSVSLRLQPLEFRGRDLEIELDAGKSEPGAAPTPLARPPDSELP